MRLIFYRYPKCFSFYFFASVKTLFSVAGGVLVGKISDVMHGRRACVIGAFMVVLVVLLLSFAWAIELIPPTALLAMLGLMGFLVRSKSIPSIPLLN